MAHQATKIYTNVFLLPFIYAELAKTMAVKLQADATFGQATLLGTTTTAVNEVQTLTMTGTPTGGTFRLSFKGATTTAIAHNASAATVQAALEALVTIGTGGVTCTGGALPGTAVVITFAGTSTAGRPQPAITFGSNLLTGGMHRPRPSQKPRRESKRADLRRGTAHSLRHHRHLP